MRLELPEERESQARQVAVFLRNAYQKALLQVLTWRLLLLRGPAEP
jgi:hypothetical protein